MFSRSSSATALALALFMLAPACGSLGGANDGSALELERLQVGSVYGSGSHFRSDGLEFSIDVFDDGLGNVEISTLAPASTQAKHAPKTLRLSHAMLRCTGRSTQLVEFDFVDRGGAVALECGGVQKRADDFIALDGQQIGSVQVTVKESSTAGVRRGHVRLSGSIAKLAVAGDDLELAGLRLR